MQSPAGQATRQGATGQGLRVNGAGRMEAIRRRFMGVLWRWLPIGAALLMSACATRPSGVMLPVAEISPRSHAVDMLVVTNRMPSETEGEVYSYKRSREVSLEQIVIGIPPDENRQKGVIQWPRSRHPDPEKHFVTQAVNPMDEKGLQTWIREQAKQNNGNVLIFVHGYNTPFDGGVYLFAQVVHDSEMKVVPLLFAWPSRGNLFGYNYDRESTTSSRTVFANLIERIAEADEVKSITILAHSMGGWLTMEALRTGVLRGDDYKGKLEDVILASPDIDVDVFYSQFEDMQGHTPNITLLVSRDDNALRIARRIGGDIDRLGAVDLTKEPYKSGVESANLRVIDVSALKVKDSTRHLKFSESPELVRLIGQSLVNGQQLSEGQTSLYEELGIIITGSSRDIVEGVERARKNVQDVRPVSEQGANQVVKNK